MLLIHRDEFTRKLRNIWSWIAHPTVPSIIPTPLCVSEQVCLRACETKLDALQAGDLAVIGDVHRFAGMCGICSSAANDAVCRSFSRFYTSELRDLFELPLGGGLARFSH